MYVCMYVCVYPSGFSYPTNNYSSSIFLISFDNDMIFIFKYVTTITVILKYNRLVWNNVSIY